MVDVPAFTAESRTYLDSGTLDKVVDPPFTAESFTFSGTYDMVAVAVFTAKSRPYLEHFI
jgi:hypothetical protein